MDMGAWASLVKRAERALALDESLALITIGMSHADAEQVLEADRQRLEKERQEYITGKMDRPGQVLRQKARRKKSTMLDKAVRMVRG